jgi:hypothetical protein
MINDPFDPGATAEADVDERQRQVREERRLEESLGERFTRETGGHPDDVPVEADLETI